MGTFNVTSSEGGAWDRSADDPYNNDKWSIDFTRNGATLIG